jgi:hypothetical protein
VSRDARSKRRDRVACAGQLEAELGSICDDGEHLAMASASSTGLVLSSGMRMPCASITLAIARIGLRAVDQQSHGHGRSDFEPASLVGEHEPPVEVLADDKAEQDAALDCAVMVQSLNFPSPS